MRLRRSRRSPVVAQPPVGRNRQLARKAEHGHQIGFTPGCEPKRGAEGAVRALHRETKPTGGAAAIRFAAAPLAFFFGSALPPEMAVRSERQSEVTKCFSAREADRST